MNRQLHFQENFTDEEIKQAFAKSLKELRFHCDVTLRVLEEFTQVPHQSLSSYERGKTLPTISQAFRIARYFGLTIDDFICYGLDRPYSFEKDFPDITAKYDATHQE